MNNIEIPSDFDWEYYIEENPDVAKHSQYSTKIGAEKHWKRWGHKEKRLYKKTSLLDINNTESSELINETQSKKLTIVIPNKLGENPEITISSLYKQTFTDFDVIIINDHDGNANKARNKGLKNVKTQYVLFSDNDISWCPDALQNMIDCLENNPEISIAYGSCRIDIYTGGEQEWDEELLLKRNYISMMSVVRTKDHPGFDENIKRLQDWDVWLTMLENQKQGKYINKKIFTTTSSKDGISKNSIKFEEAVLIIKEKHKNAYFPRKKIVIEVPDNNTNSGEINRMRRLVVELPKYNITCGGINESIKLSNAFIPQAMIRFQKLTGSYPQINNKWSVGLPDHTFPPCDACITYSDTPYLSELVNLPQVKKTFVYMLSYGMAIERERKNVRTKNVTILCSTKKLENIISKENVKVHRIGFGLDSDEMYEMNISRKNYLIIMFHPSNEKKYYIAVQVADDLYEKKIIDGVVTFGMSQDYEKFQHPKGLVKHYPNASREEIRKIFNSGKCFLMPSISEGLNLTPFESTLCGCPSILCDGAINELFFDKKNCFVVNHNNAEDMINTTKEIVTNFKKYSQPFRKHMIETSKEFTWENVIKNLNKIL